MWAAVVKLLNKALIGLKPGDKQANSQWNFACMLGSLILVPNLNKAAPAESTFVVWIMTQQILVLQQYVVLDFSVLNSSHGSLYIKSDSIFMQITVLYSSEYINMTGFPSFPCFLTNPCGSSWDVDLKFPKQGSHHWHCRGKQLF